MEARELAEEIREVLECFQDAQPSTVWDGAATSYAYGDADFFLELDGGERFLVTVAKVSE